MPVLRPSSLEGRKGRSGGRRGGGDAERARSYTWFGASFFSLFSPEERAAKPITLTLSEIRGRGEGLAGGGVEGVGRGGKEATAHIGIQTHIPFSTRVQRLNHSAHTPPLSTTATTEVNISQHSTVCRTQLPRRHSALTRIKTSRQYSLHAIFISSTTSNNTRRFASAQTFLFPLAPVSLCHGCCTYIHTFPWVHCHYKNCTRTCYR